jgi:hypothetical protein
VNGLPEQSSDVVAQSDVIAYALAAIAPYKAEIKLLRQQLGQPLETERENAKLRELLEQVAEESAPWTKTLMSTEWGKLCRAALGDRP